MNQSKMPQHDNRNRDVLGKVIATLVRGTKELIAELRGLNESKVLGQLSKLQELQVFFETLQVIQSSMPEDRFREAILQTIGSIQKYVKSIPRSVTMQIRHTDYHTPSETPKYLVDAIQMMGSDLRLSKDEMSAWIVVRSEYQKMLSPVSVLANLQQRGVVFGVDDTAIHSLFEVAKFDEEVLVATGQRPQKGEDGYIQYDQRIQERNRIPKRLEGGRVSFKEIDLFVFLTAGETIAICIPPKPGLPGQTVTGRMIHPLPTQELNLPSCKHAIKSIEGDRLIAEIDGCIWMENGRLRFHPMVHVRESVSYKTGNIDSEVGVLIERDVPSGFSVHSKRDVTIGGTVESARVESEGNILIKGGIEGNNKGCVKATGNIFVRHISNGIVETKQSLFVESGIVQSSIWSGMKVVVTSSDSQIVGGTIDADSTVTCNTIGSELGVKTFIRLGRMLDDLHRKIQLKQSEITGLQQRVEQCSGLVESLQTPTAVNESFNGDVDLSLSRTQSTREETEKELERCEEELLNLQTQYEKSLQTPRTIRVRQTIYPGVVLEIQGVQLKIKEPTVPVTVAKSGEELVLLPYKELED